MTFNPRVFALMILTLVMSDAAALAQANEPAPASNATAPVIPPAPKEPPPPTTLPSPGTSAVVLDLSAIDSVIGKSVKSFAGEDMGRIVDVLVTPAGEVRAAVIDFGGLLGVGSRKVAVAWKALDFSKSAKGGAAILGLTRNEVRVSPEYKAGDPVVVLEAAPPPANATGAPPPAPAAPASK